MSGRSKINYHAQQSEECCGASRAQDGSRKDRAASESIASGDMGILVMGQLRKCCVSRGGSLGGGSAFSISGDSAFEARSAWY